MLRRRFGEAIRRLRVARRLTQEQLAARSALSVDAIRRLERGGFSPSLQTLAKLSEGLALSLPTLFRCVEVRRDHVAELCDFLCTRSPPEISVASRVLRALFDER